MMAYFDKNGGVNMHPLIRAENHPLYRAYYEFWRYLVTGTITARWPSIDKFLKKTNWKKGWYQANIPERGSHFSRDNMWGVYFLNLMAGNDIKDLPVFKWNGKIRWHPNQWAVFLSLKYKWCKKLLHPLVWGMYKYSQLKHQRDHSYTTGPCLWTLMKYHLWNKKPNRIDITAFKYYCTHGYKWDLMSQPIVNYVEEYERGE